MPSRTGGWLFAVDCRRGECNVLAGYEFINNENMSEKAKVIGQVLRQPAAKCVKALVHDDMCHFRAYCKKHKAKGFVGIKTWLIDKWHRKNHVVAPFVAVVICNTYIDTVQEPLRFAPVSFAPNRQ